MRRPNDKVRSVITLSLSLVIAALSVGCHYSPRQVSASLTPINPYKKYEVLPKVSGEDCVFSLLYFMNLAEGPRVERAIAAAVPVGSNVDDIIGLTIESKTVVYVIGAEYCVVVSGYPIRFLDTKGKGGIFAYEKNPQRFAPIGSDAAPTPAPVAVAPAPRPTVTPRPTPPPPPKTRPVVSNPVVTAPRPTPTPAPPPPPPAGDGRDPIQTDEDGEQFLDCGILCDNYVRPIRNQSAVIRDIILKRCAERCNGGNMPFIECAMEARSTTDVSRCNQL
jgi:hypothetical protein